MVSTVSHGNVLDNFDKRVNPMKTFGSVLRILSASRAMCPMRDRAAPQLASRRSARAARALKHSSIGRYRAVRCWNCSMVAYLVGALRSVEFAFTPRVDRF
jgi:hypothetical protein